MLDYFFHLGFDRFKHRQNALIFLLVFQSFFAFADFTDNDSINLDIIKECVYDGTGDIATIKDVLLNYTYDHSRPGLENTSRGFNVYDRRASGYLAQISNILYNVNSKLNVLDVVPTPAAPAVQSIAVHDVRTDNIYNRLADITNQLERVAVAVEGLSSSSSIGGDVYFQDSFLTNYPALFAYVVDHSEDENDFYLKSLFFTLYGRYPTDLEMQRFRTVLNSFGLSNWVRWCFQTGIDYYSLPISLQEQMNLFYDNPASGMSWDEQETYSSALYYLFGTHDLLEVSQAISNSVDKISKVFISDDDSSQAEFISNISNPVSYDSSTEETTYNSSVVNVIADLADDAVETLPAISDDLVEADTNDINQVENKSYSGQLAALVGANPEEDKGDFDDVLDALENQEFTSDLFSALSESPDEFVLSFDLSGFNLTSGNRKNRDLPEGSINFTVTDVRETTNGYVSFFCSFFQCVISLYFASLLWDVIFQSGPNFYRG